MLDMTTISRIQEYVVKCQCKNESDAVEQIVTQHERFQYIIQKLEEKAHESEEWKKKAVVLEKVKNHSGAEKRVGKAG
jgi:hypothetical protein